MAIWTQPMRTHNLTQTQDAEVPHDWSNCEYCVLANGMRQESMVYLRGLQGQFCYARRCFVWNLLFFFLINSFFIFFN